MSLPIRISPRSLPVFVAVAVGALWRLWLMGRYAGWEESDYGNLAMVRGVLDGGFLHYDMNHMPGYYALAAVVLAVVDDTVVAARATSLIGGLVALGLSTRLAVHLGGRQAGWLAGLLLVIQPEFALYASSSLREPVVAAFILACLTALISERMAWAGLFAGCAFLVRFDSALVLGPVLALHACGYGDRAKRLLRSLLPLLVAVALWAVYCRFEHGTLAFWSHSVQVNVETGLGAEAQTGAEWWANGLGVVGGLLAWLLPWRLGWGLWLGLGLASLGILGWRHGTRRTLGCAAVLMLGLWAGIGLVGQHAPSHNLYWKWLCPIVPVVMPVAVIGLQGLVGRLSGIVGPVGGTTVLLLAVSQAVFSNVKETERQRSLSEAWYRPQLELAQWVEEAIPEDVPLLIDNIPACWIRRRPNERPMTSWFDVPVHHGDAEGFGLWVHEEKIQWVLWFREQWTQAPLVAPFLEDGGTWVGGGVQLKEVRREDGYGWILFEVSGVVAPEPDERTPRPLDDQGDDL